VTVQDGSLTIQVEKRFEHEEAGRTYFFSERECGAFQRSFRFRTRPPTALTQRSRTACESEWVGDGLLRRWRYDQDQCVSIKRPRIMR
jgi:hypothetical protein